MLRAPLPVQYRFEDFQIKFHFVTLLPQMFLGRSLVLAKPVVMLLEYSGLGGVLAGLKGVLIMNIF